MPSQGRIVLRAGGTARAAARRGVRDREARARGSSRVLLPELGTQTLERAREPRLDGAAAAAERGGRLLLREVEEVAAGDGDAMVLVEPVHGREQLVAP